MIMFRIPGWIAACAVSAVQAAAAQGTAAPIDYKSAFDGYQRFSDEEVQPWKDSNATVEKIGGWRAYAKEAQGAKAPASAASGSAPADPHAGHRKP